MLDFTGNSFNKRALKRAMKELSEEDALKQIATVEKTEPTREYKTTKEADDYKSLKRHNALSKPQTEAVDLKHFKDWRKVDKVDSKNPPFVPKRPIFDGDDEGEQPAIDGPVDTNKNDLINKLAAINNDKDKTENKELDFNTFFKEKYKKQADAKPVEKTSPITTTTTKTNSIRDQVKSSLSDILKRKSDEEVIQTTKKETGNLEADTKTIKVEVVDLTEKKEVQAPPVVKKPPVKRKPRGKNKRRFDADVISSIDWK